MAEATYADMNPHDLTQTLVESFNALADEVQNLNDRQTILEHKLRFAHEQVSKAYHGCSSYSCDLPTYLCMVTITVTVTGTATIRAPQ